MKARQESVGAWVSLGAGWPAVFPGTTSVYLALGRVYLCCRWHAQPTCPLNNVSLCAVVITSFLLLMTSLPFPANFATVSPAVFDRSFPSSALFPYDGFWVLWCPSSLLTPLFIILNLSRRGLATGNFPTFFIINSPPQPQWLKLKTFASWRIQPLCQQVNELGGILASTVQACPSLGQVFCWETWRAWIHSVFFRFSRSLVL